MAYEFEILEHECPECQGELRMTKIGGTEEFLDNWTVPAGVKRQVLSEKALGELGRILGGYGYLEYVCKSCGRDYFIEKTVGNDWASSV